jgi:hypothetical protein
MIENDQLTYFSDFCELTMGPNLGQVSDLKLRNAIKGMFLCNGWQGQFPDKMIDEQKEYLEVHNQKIEGDINNYFISILNCPAFQSLVKNMGGSFNAFYHDFYKLIFNYGNSDVKQQLANTEEGASIKKNWKL